MLLVVVLLLVMTTSTAVFALRTTSGEQRAASEYSESIWSRSVAEGMTMAAMGWEELNSTPLQMGNTQNLDQRWMNQGSGAVFTTRYGLQAQTPGRGRSLDGLIDTQRFDMLRFPNGPAGFVVTRNALAPFQAPAPSARALDYRSLATDMSFLTYGSVGPGSQNATFRVRTVVTGFGETRAPTDRSEGLTSAGAGTGQRGEFTSIGVVRGYLDTVPPPF